MFSCLQRYFPNALFITVFTISLHAQAEVKLNSDLNIGNVPKTTLSVKVDGKLDDPAWQEAREVWFDIETRPGENIQAKVRTKALLIENGINFYIAFYAYDPNPDLIRAHYNDRDSAFQDDFVGIVLDTFNDGELAFEFFSNPYGAQMDMINDGLTGREDESWNAVWESGGKIVEDGYIVEMAIPFRILRFKETQEQQLWAVDLIRFYPRENRYRIASNPMDRSKPCYLCELSKMQGFQGIKPGKNMELVPTVTLGQSDERDDPGIDPWNEGSLEEEAGLDFRWGVTPNISLNATLNPDFSQVEADVAQLDINNTFSLFFPEKRPFFLEGADFFKSPINAVYTRNIADPDYGGKVVGKEGKHTFAAFITDDKETNFLIPESTESDVAEYEQESDNSVLRYRYSIMENSSLGMIYTARDSLNYYNDVYGVDAHIKLNDHHVFDAQLLNSKTVYPLEIQEEYSQAANELSGDAYKFHYEFSSREWFTYINYENFDKDFRADMGFVNQVDFDKFIIGQGRVWHAPSGRKWNRIQIRGDWDVAYDQSGQLLEKESEIHINMNAAYQSFFVLGVVDRERFSDGILFDETFQIYLAEVQPWSGTRFELFVKSGDQIDFSNNQLGKVLEISPNFGLNIGKHFKIDFSHTYETLDVPDGRLYTANLSYLKLKYQFNNNSFLRMIMQYNDIESDPALYDDPEDVFRVDKSLGSQLLYSYKLNPQTVVYAGYSNNFIETDEVQDMAQDQRSLFVKMSYAWIL